MLSQSLMPILSLILLWLGVMTRFANIELFSVMTPVFERLTLNQYLKRLILTPAYFAKFVGKLAHINVNAVKTLIIVVPNVNGRIGPIIELSVN